uniref:Si:dkey-29b11.3 n=1 Tax=Oryzias sinensis TaxID=183150 RepID=A0A8C7XA42_9TELE
MSILEVQELCQVIRSIGELKERDGTGTVITVEFGKLFEHYVTISNKLVGILLRARKQRLVHFEGEMLWQGKDDHVVISLEQ